ncbi:MAG: hypothetical protein ACREMF_06995, partial [Gemmatimonadales bacterium]
PLERALASVSDDALHERAALAAAECLLRRGEAGQAESLLAPVLGSSDGRRRSLAAYVAGRAAFQRGDHAAAADLFARSETPEAGPAHMRALVAAGRSEQAAALMDNVRRRSRDEATWLEVLEDLGRAAGAPAAADALDRLLARGRMAPGTRARLLLGDGDRLRTARLFERASTRYVTVVALVPDSVEAGRARVRSVLVQAAEAREPADLDSLAKQIVRLSSRGGLAGAALLEARALQRHLVAIRTADSTAIGAFRGAELVRDTLAAPALAASLFLQVAARYPASLFAPKALIAAGHLRPDAVDSVDAVLRTSYAQSPYTQAFHGASSPAFQVLEDSLAIAYGVTRLAPSTTLAALRFAAPRPGPRGPQLDPSLGVAILRAAGRPVPPTDRQPPRPPRPGETPEERPGERP